MKQFKVILSLLITITLVGCNMDNNTNEQQYSSIEEEMEAKANKYVGNGWYKFDEDNENHQAVLEDFPYADMEEIPIKRFETDTTIAYGYDIKYADEVRRRNRMMEYDVYDLIQDRYIDLMKEVRAGLSEYYDLDAEGFRFDSLGSTNSGATVVTFLHDTEYVAMDFILYYEIEPDEVNLEFKVLNGSRYNSIKKSAAIKKLLSEEIKDYGEWLKENTAGCQATYGYNTTGIGFKIDERLREYLVELGMENEEIRDYQDKMYEIIYDNSDKSGTELKAILKEEIGLDTYAWIEFVPSCGLGGDSPVRPPADELVARKELYKGLITYSDINIRSVFMNQYYAVNYLHPSALLRENGYEDDYNPVFCDKIIGTDNTIDDHNSWYGDKNDYYDNDPNWTTATIEDRMDE